MTSDYGTRRLYDHERSKAARIKERTGPRRTPVEVVELRHKAEKGAHGAQLREETLALGRKLDQARMRNSNRDRDASGDDRNEDRQRKQLADRHANDKATLAARHSRELADAKRRHPID
jgi:hypothetical protein